MRDQNSKVIELQETLPSEPLRDIQRNTIAFHGVMYAFPDYSEDQILALIDQMIEVNKSGKFSMLNNLLERLGPFRVGKARRRRPGQRFKRGKPMEIAKK